MSGGFSFSCSCASSVVCIFQFTWLEYFLLQYFTGLECGHKFCMQCWGDYLTTKIIEEGMGQVFTRVMKWNVCLKKQTCSALNCSTRQIMVSFQGVSVGNWPVFVLFFQTISCPAHSCDILVDDNTVMWVLLLYLLVCPLGFVQHWLLPQLELWLWRAQQVHFKGKIFLTDTGKWDLECSKCVFGLIHRHKPLCVA